MSSMSLSRRCDLEQDDQQHDDQSECSKSDVHDGSPFVEGALPNRPKLKHRLLPVVDGAATIG